MSTALVIGAGPAGLMAADVLSAAGVAVTIADHMPSVGRKFLMAGKSGLNLTKVEPDFGAAFDGPMVPIVAGFGPDQVMDWAQALGQDVFTGSTGRVFPKAMKASPLLRAWMGRLAQQGVSVRTRHKWVGWDGLDHPSALFQDHDRIKADIYILALGGGSWARLGSDGLWWDHMSQVAPFRPANCGFMVDWSPHMAPHLGQPVKNIGLMAGDLTSRGEIVISTRGIEGGGIYEVSRAMRDGAPLTLDLLPDRTSTHVATALGRPRGKASMANHLRKALKLDGVRMALLNEFGRPFGDDLAHVIKALPVAHAGPRPLDEAISTAGGLRFDALDDDLMFQTRPGLFAAGEMLDWEAPTGGYLITGCLATGRHAAKGALAYLAKHRAQVN